MNDASLSFPATLRNREPILTVLRDVLTRQSRVLEVASGSGEHATYLAPRLGCLRQPSDVDPAARGSIVAWTKKLQVEANVLPPLALDATTPPWPSVEADAVVCINMIHIAPPEATTGLLSGAASLLPVGGTLILYGPFRRDGAHSSESNAVFDAFLKDKDPGFGVRALEDVAAQGARVGLQHTDTVSMPANNLIVVLKRQGSPIP